MDQADELLPEGVVRPALVQPLQKGLRPEHKNVEPSPHGGMAQGIGQVRFSDSHRTADDDILVIADILGDHAARAVREHLLDGRRASGGDADGHRGRCGCSCRGRRTVPAP